MEWKTDRALLDDLVFRLEHNRPDEWDGGTAFWVKILQPEKLTVIDILTRGDSRYFQDFIRSRNLSGRVSTHWGFDQARRDATRDFVQ